MAATSDPASGSEQQYAAKIGSAGSRDRYCFFCSSEPATRRGVAPSELAAIDVFIPEQPNETSSWTRQLSRQLPPSPPYSDGISMFISPVSQARLRISRGNSPVSS